MILSVCSSKGGVGKTTVSTLLAAYTAKHTEKKILLIDADHNRGSSSVFFSNREPEDSIGKNSEIQTAYCPYKNDPAEHLRDFSKYFLQQFQRTEQ